MNLFIYTAHLEIQKEIEERKVLIEQLNSIDARLEARNLYLLGMYRGFISLGKQNTSDRLKNLIIGGEQQMKYQGISIIRNNKCNTWYARYRVAGKQFYISAKTQQQCYEKLKEAIKQKNKLEIKSISSKKQDNTKTITFIDWYKKWLVLFKSDVKEITIRDYKSSLNYLECLFNKPLNKITSIEILELLNKISFERRKQKVYELLNDLFNRATQNDIIEKNPLLKIDKPKHKKINGLAISNEDEKLFEDYLIKENLDMFLICLYQGLRKGEMLALTIDDFDFKNNTLSINKSLNDKNKIDTTKNEYSVRVIPLFDKTINLMQKYKNKKGRVFDYSYKQSTHLFEKFIQKYFSGKKYTAHSLRHTFVTRCQESNIPLHIIQKWVGHAKGSAVTNSVYTHARELAEIQFMQEFNQKMNNL